MIKQMDLDGIKIYSGETESRIAFFDYDSKSYAYNLEIYTNKDQALEDFSVFINSLRLNN